MTEVAMDWITMAGVIATIAFLWRLSGDMRKEIGDLRERMARLEGLFEGFAAREKSKGQS